jgi:hypothetical protein
MALQIIKGKKFGAVRAIFSGTEGIGKTTLATQIPDSIIVDTEDGSGQIDCARVLALDWRAIEFATKELIADTQGYKTVIFDSADWLERALIEWMLKQSGKKSIEDYGFGKGYTILQEHFSRFLALCDELIAKGIHVIFVAHTKTVRVSPPDQTDGYDSYALKLTKQVSPLLKEWSDLYLFANYKIQIVEGNDGKLKALGGKERVMYANRCAAWDAKNRFGLPDEMPMDFAQVAHVFSGAAPRAAAKVEPVKAVVVHPLTKGLVAASKALDAVKPADQIPGLEETALNLTPKYTEWLMGNEASVNAYLVQVKWIVNGQTWRDLNNEEVNKIVDKSDKFARAAGIPVIGGKEKAP